MAKTYNQPILQQDANQNVIQESYLSGMKFVGEYTGTNLIYRGYARPGVATSEAKWQICKMTYDGDDNVTNIDWPEADNGSASSEFIFVWDDRASYTFS
jgi:hypothetical protein